MTYGPLRTVVWRNELVALAGAERFHLVAPWLHTPHAAERDIEFVLALCLYHREVLAGRLPEGGGPDRAERWAHALLHLRREATSG